MNGDQQITLRAAADALSQMVGRPADAVEEMLRAEVETELAAGSAFWPGLERAKQSVLRRIAAKLA